MIVGESKPMDEHDCKCRNRYCYYSTAAMQARNAAERVVSLEQHAAEKRDKRAAEIEELKQVLAARGDVEIIESWIPENLDPGKETLNTKESLLENRESPL